MNRNGGMCILVLFVKKGITHWRSQVTPILDHQRIRSILVPFRQEHKLSVTHNTALKTMIKHCVWDGWQVCFLCDDDEERESLDCVKVYFPSWRAAQECIPPLLFKQCFVLKISQQAVVQTLLGKGLFLSVAHPLLPLQSVGNPLDKAHLPIVFN